MTTSPELLYGSPRTYGGTGLGGSRQLIALREERPLNPVISEDQTDEEIQIPIQGFADTQAWTYTIEAGPPLREVAGMLVPNDNVGLCMTDAALELKGKVLQTTNAADLVNYQPATITVPNTILSSQKLTLLMDLFALCSLPEDERWPDSDWPTVEAFDDALRFITLLPVNLIELPHISLANDGEVNFGWKSDAMHIDLGFYGTGTYSYFAKGNDGSECFGDDIPVSPPFPNDLFDILSN